MDLMKHLKESKERFLYSINKDELKKRELGEILYLAMGVCNNHKIVMGIGYTPEYANKKAKEFEQASNGLCIYKDISVVRTGEKKKFLTIQRS